MAALTTTTLFAASAPDTLLWPDGAPQAKGTAITDQPALSVHLPPAEKANGTAVIVTPGGGYYVLASDHEGLQVAKALNRYGITAFVLRYRVQPDYAPSVSLIDAQRAIRFVRHHAERYDIDPKRIGMLGFSAGGHLTAACGTQYDAGNPDAEDPIEQASSRPNFLVPIYPAIDSKLFPGERDINWPSPNEHVTADTPPTFLVHTHEDNLSPNHSIAFYQALLEHKVQAELHIFGIGPHGTGIAPGDPDLGRSPELLQRWLSRNGLLTAERRVAVNGNVRVDGKPLYWGWVTLDPEDPNRPTSAVYLHFEAKGKLEIDTAHGPTLGKHRVTVHVVSTDFSAPKSGAYSVEDAIRIDENPDGSPIYVTITEENREALEISVAMP